MRLTLGTLACSLAVIACGTGSIGGGPDAGGPDARADDRGTVDGGPAPDAADSGEVADSGAATDSGAAADAAAPEDAGSSDAADASAIDAAPGPDLPLTDVDLPPNTWVKLTDHTHPGGNTGPRNYAGMVYEPSTGEYVLIGGTLSYSERPRPYDVQALTLADPRWRNQYPLNKVGQWGPEIGDAAAPFYGDESWGELDPEGVARPNWQLYPGAKLYHQYAYNPATHTIAMFLWNHSFSYDVLRRTYSFFSPATAPGGGPTNPRLLWGAMAFDAVDNKVLLFGGGNVLEPDGQPGTWIFEVGPGSWRRVAGPGPGPRALSPLVSDPDQRRALLFGGDELDRLLGDTWSFDFASETWTQLHPSIVPAPRAGHQLLFLPGSRRVVLLGGYDYSSTTDYVQPHYTSRPLELWRFDWNPPAWNLIHRWSPGEPQPTIQTSSNFSYPAAAGAGDVIVTQFKNGYPGVRGGSETWALRAEVATVDAAGTQQLGVVDGSTLTRSGPYDPGWYTTGWPAPDPVGFSAALDQIPANVWTEIAVPNRPAHNHDWGTAALDPDRQVILRFSGGHSAHSGTDVLEYSLRENRYRLSYASELPLDFEYSNDQVPGQWSFDANPWMTGHTYRTYAYSRAVGKMVLVKAPYTYYYDLDRHDWEPNPATSSVGGNFYQNITLATPSGMMLWNNNGLFNLNAAQGTWTSQALTGAALPNVSGLDGNVAVWDSQRGRALLFAADAGAGNSRGQVWAYAAGAVSTLSPGGAAAMEASSEYFHREAVYQPVDDLVLLATKLDAQGVARTPVYDCAANRWFAYDFGPLQATIYGNSLGVVIDALGRVWAVDTNSRVYLLKINAATASRSPL